MSASAKKVLSFLILASFFSTGTLLAQNLPSRDTAGAEDTRFVRDVKHSEKLRKIEREATEKPEEDITEEKKLLR